MSAAKQFRLDAHNQPAVRASFEGQRAEPGRSRHWSGSGVAFEDIHERLRGCVISNCDSDIQTLSTLESYRIADRGGTVGGNDRHTTERQTSRRGLRDGSRSGSQPRAPKRGFADTGPLERLSIFTMRGGRRNALTRQSETGVAKEPDGAGD
jgi:hypothetical protein